MSGIGSVIYPHGTFTSYQIHRRWKQGDKGELSPPTLEKVPIFPPHFEPNLYMLHLYFLLFYVTSGVNESLKLLIKQIFKNLSRISQNVCINDVCFYFIILHEYMFQKMH